MNNDMTLAIITNGDKVLLGLKKRGFGKGLWNGFGGKIEEGETPETALVRECMEEAGIAPAEYERAGNIIFYNQTENGVLTNRVYIFLCNGVSGEPIETEEMRPKWFDKNNLPFKKMWDADGRWIPPVLSGKYIEGSVVLDNNQRLIEANLTEN